MRQPYPGLRPFHESEADLFFGRDEHIRTLREKLEANRFVAVVGTSGSGKSSLVRAGLIPRLKGLMEWPDAQSLPNPRPAWLIAEMRPGICPMAALAEALLSASALGPARRAQMSELPAAQQTEALESDVKFFAETLQRGPLGIAELIEQTPLPSGTKLLIFVDQFEEIFRFRKEGPCGISAEANPSSADRAVQQRWVNEAEAFVALLLQTARLEVLGVHVLLTMRLDYLAECAVFTGLPEAINGSQFLTPRLNRDQRVETIIAPARKCGGEVAAELTHQLVNDTGPDLDQLPLLQHCLMRMWTIATEPRDGQRPSEWCFTLDHYADPRIGTLRQCLSTHADAIYTTLTASRPEHERALYQRAIETTFRCLTAANDDKPDSRRPQPWSALREVVVSQGGSEASLVEILDAFRHADCSFLTPRAGVPLKPDTTIDISHESLIRNWAALKTWVKAEADSGDEYRFLERAARLNRGSRAGVLSQSDVERLLEWRKRERPTLEWAARYKGDFGLAMKFLDGSAKVLQLRALKEKADKNKLVIIGACLAVALVTILAGFTFYFKNEAAQEIEKNKLRIAGAIKDLQLEEAKRQADEAAQRTAEAKKNLVDVLTRSDAAVREAKAELQKKIEDEQKTVLARAELFSRERLGIAKDILTREKSSTKANVLALHHLAKALQTKPDSPEAAELARTLLSTLQWQLPLTRTVTPVRGSGNILAGTFTPDGKQCVSVCARGAFLYWDSANLSPTATLWWNGKEFAALKPDQQPTPFMITGANFSANGKRLLIVFDTSPPNSPPPEKRPGAVFEWKGAAYQLQGTFDYFPEGGKTRWAGWNDTGDLLAIAAFSWETALQFYRRNGTRYELLPVAAATTAKDDMFIAGDFAADGKTLVTSNPTGTLRIWDAATFDPSGRSAPLKELPTGLRPWMVTWGPGKTDLTLQTFMKPVMIDSLSGQRRDLNGAGQEPVWRIVRPQTSSGVQIAALARSGKVLVTKGDTLEALSQPIVINGSGIPTFSPDGQRLLVLSGPSWMESEYLRLWDARIQPPIPAAAALSYSGNIPKWLGDLAEAVSGQPLASPDDVPPFPTLDAVREKYSSVSFPANTSDGYGRIWNRFFPPAPAAANPPAK